MAKGNSYERKICKILSKWYSKKMFGEEREDVFWRTAGSGARATTRRKQNKNTCDSYGDVCAIHEDGKKFTKSCLVELKRGYTSKAKIITSGKRKGKIKSPEKNDTISLLHMVDKNDTRAIKEPLIIRWLEKANKEAKEAEIKHILIIFQRDQGQSCIVLQDGLWKKLEKNNQKKWVFPHDGQYIHVSYKAKLSKVVYDFYIVRLHDFLYWCHPKAFFEAVSKLPQRKNKKYDKSKYYGAKIKKFKGIAA